MENRERDQMSKNTQSTPAGDVNRNTSSQSGKEKSDSSADFGQNIGRSENLNEPNSRGSNSGSSGWDNAGKDSSTGGYDSSGKNSSSGGYDSSKSSGSSSGSKDEMPKGDKGSDSSSSR
ncbi:MAG: hypothetical protein QOC81_3277 [Thermoanaerobaculia bacterium]|nr:hypothetical protein [Thermoanaerobaculia bacterium]